MNSLKVKQDNKTTTLIIEENKLIIPDTEPVELDSIYGVDKSNHHLTIHYAQKQVVTQEQTQTNTSLLNVRPGDILWKRHTLDVEVDDDNDAFIEKLKIPVSLGDKQVVVFINPAAGTQQAKTHWKETVKPMLMAAGAQHIQEVMTEGGGKTRSLAQQLGKQFTSDTIIICMGGDGTLHEVVNGLADNPSQTAYRVGVIPVGSGNAFSLSLNIESVEHAVLKIIRGTTNPFHIMHVKLGHATEDDWINHVVFEETKPIRLLVVMSWGFHAQIVSKSRYLRYFMGNIRFSLVAKFLLYFLKQYRGDMVIKNGARYDAKQDAFVPQDDVVLNEKPFTYFIASKQHSLERGFKIAPFASPLTFDMDLVVLRDATADSLMGASIEAFQGGSHVKSPVVEYYKTSAFLLRVDEKTELCLDGEICDLPAKGIVQVSMIGPSNEPTFLTFV
jgi:diacylglycerol kinase family enzyme